MSTCTATYIDSYRYSDFAKAMPPMPCFKPVDEIGRHRGEHQTFLPVAAPPPSPFDPDKTQRPAFVRLAEWSEGGASLTSYDRAKPETNCMCGTNNRVGHSPEDHHWTRCCDCGSITNATRPDPVRCGTCGIWARRAAEAASGKWRYLRAEGDDYLYSFDASNPGGFGGRRVTITMLDGTVVAKDQAGLWSAGRMPWWCEDSFPVNCTFESGTGTDKVPGHTDSFGNPLAYTGGPTPA